MNSNNGVNNSGTTSPLKLRKMGNENNNQTNTNNIINLNKENTGKVGLEIGLMTISIIVAYIFTLKFYEPVPNVLVTGGIFSYPITFLLTLFITDKYGLKESKKSIYISSSLFLLFLLLIIISLLPVSNTTTMQYNSIVQYLFANNQFHITNNIIFYYPTLGQCFGILFGFIISHLLTSIIYNSISKVSSYIVSAGIALFIGYSIDRIIFVILLFIEGLIAKDNTIDFVIRFITSECLASLIASIIILILFIIIKNIKFKKRKI